MGNNREEQKKKNADAFNDMILGNLKSRSGKDTTKWLNNLSNDDDDDGGVGAVAAPEAKAQQAQPAYSMAAAQQHIKWVDKLFDLLQQYESEFNRVAPSPELTVTTERPVVTPDLMSRMRGNDTLHFHGRLYTRYWTLIIVGNLYYLEGFIVPSDHYIGFEANHAKYTQFFEVNANWNGELSWDCDSTMINQGLLPAFAKQLFGQIIKVAKGEASDEERFQLGPSKKKTKNQIEGEAPATLNHGNVFDDGAFLTNPQTPSNVTTNAPKSGSQTGSQQRKEFPSGKTIPPQESDYLVGPEPTREKKTSAKAPTDQSSAQTNLSNLSAAEACDVLEAALDRQLSLIAKAGASAFESHNFSEVEKMLKKTAQMKEFKEQVTKSLTEWKRILNEELN